MFQFEGKKGHPRIHKNTQAQTHTHACARAHTNTSTNTHAHAQTHAHATAQTHTQAHTQPRAGIHACARLACRRGSARRSTHIGRVGTCRRNEGGGAHGASVQAKLSHSLTRTHTRTHARIHTHAHTRARTHTRTHADTRTHAGTRARARSLHHMHADSYSSPSTQASACALARTRCTGWFGFPPRSSRRVCTSRANGAPRTSSSLVTARRRRRAGNFRPPNPSRLTDTRAWQAWHWAGRRRQHWAVGTASRVLSVRGERARSRSWLSYWRGHAAGYVRWRVCFCAGECACVFLRVLGAECARVRQSMPVK
jgi:hypothetical protein